MLSTTRYMKFDARLTTKVCIFQVLKSKFEPGSLESHLKVGRLMGTKFTVEFRRGRKGLKGEVHPKGHNSGVIRAHFRNH